MAALGVGVLVRGHGWQRLLSAVPIGGAVAYHTLNNYAAQHNESTDALHWLETLDAEPRNRSSGLAATFQQPHSSQVIQILCETRKPSKRP
ncbi:hypothetical protein [Streptomyces brevispora]|uniref:hypothetical protein n=1 Tax=Streptomyces brevispora TaxID=887462 RepID=UPI0037F379A6